MDIPSSTSESTSADPLFQSQFGSINLMEDIVILKDILQNIDWAEPWMITLVLCHILITSLNLLTRKIPTAQAFLFILITIPIFLSERLNTIAAENWRYFSKHQYFDSNGMFISLVVSAPLLFNCLLMVGNWLKISSELMSSLRRFQLQAETRKLKRKSSSSTSKKGGTGTTTETLEPISRKRKSERVK